MFAPDIGKQGSKPVQDGILRRPFPQDSQDRIVAGNGADNLNHGARIQERGHHTGMTGMGLQHRQVTGELHAENTGSHIDLRRRGGVRRCMEAKQIIGSIMHFDNAQLFQITGQRGLSHDKAFFFQQGLQFLLIGNVFASDQTPDDTLSFRFPFHLLLYFYSIFRCKDRGFLNKYQIFFEKK